MGGRLCRRCYTLGHNQAVGVIAGTRLAAKVRAASSGCDQMATKATAFVSCDSMALPSATWQQTVGKSTAAKPAILCDMQLWQF